MSYIYFWPPESEPPDYRLQNYDRGLGVDRDPSWQTRGLPGHPLVWPVGIYWDRKQKPSYGIEVNENALRHLELIKLVSEKL